LDSYSNSTAAKRVGGVALTCMLGLLALASLPGRADANVAYNTNLASPGVYFGIGNANSGFTVATANNVEIGLSAIKRYLGPITPSGDVYTAPLGNTALPNTGSAWGVTFSLNLQAGGGALTLSGIDAVLTVQDVGTGFTPAPFKDFLGLLVGNTCYDGSVVACNNPSADYGVQNSEPGSLFASIGDTNFNDLIPDTYDITLSVYGCNTNGCTSNLLATDTIQVDTPEPNAGIIFATALVGLGLLCHRRRGSRKVA